MAKINKHEEHALVDTYSVLTASGYIPSQPLKVRRLLAVAEQGRKYTLQMSGKENSVLYDIDGYIVKEGQKCDKLVLVDLSDNDAEKNWVEIFVELKGKDVSHAIDQLRETLKNPLFRHPSNKKIKARIVAASFPANKSNPLMEKAKIEFAKSPYSCELRGLKNGQKDLI